MEIMIDVVPGPMWTREQYAEAIAMLVAGSTQLQPDGDCCAICGDSGHQAWECHHNPLVKMARSDKADREWRCFICGEVFTDEESAYQHFGNNADVPPSCRLDDLTVLLRWAERQKVRTTAARPDTNVFKEMLVTTWDAVIAKITERRALLEGEKCPS